MGFFRSPKATTEQSNNIASSFNTPTVSSPSKVFPPVQTLKKEPMAVKAKAGRPVKKNSSQNRKTKSVLTAKGVYSIKRMYLLDRVFVAYYNVICYTDKPPLIFPKQAIDLSSDGSPKAPQESPLANTDSMNTIGPLSEEVSATTEDNVINELGCENPVDTTLKTNSCESDAKDIEVISEDNARDDCFMQSEKDIKIPTSHSDSDVKVIVTEKSTKKPRVPRKKKLSKKQMALNENMLAVEVATGLEGVADSAADEESGQEPPPLIELAVPTAKSEPSHTSKPTPVLPPEVEHEISTVLMEAKSFVEEFEAIQNRS